MHLISARVLFLFFTLLSTGCAAMTDAPKVGSDSFQSQRSSTEAKTQILQWVAIGTAINEAVSTLKSKGFACNPAMPITSDVRRSIVCTYSTPSSSQPTNRQFVPPEVPIHWFVTLNSFDEATVSEIQVARTPVELERRNGGR
ncbi:hypothetical protein [Ottowia sp.]|uniref:hypothetical protein n=1 Tax=Ottowia sp. TaxID=1898956 RepID=UPI003A89148D